MSYLKIQKNFALVSSHFRIWMGFYHKNSHELEQRFIMYSGLRQKRHLSKMFKFITINAALTSDSFGILYRVIASRVFRRRLTSGGIFNNRLLFSPLFSGNFVGGRNFDRERQSHDGGSGSLSPPPGKTLARVGVPLATHF